MKVKTLFRVSISAKVNKKRIVCKILQIPKILPPGTLNEIIFSKKISLFFEPGKKTTFFKIVTEGGRWRNFSLTFLESTKNLVVIIHRS